MRKQFSELKCHNETWDDVSIDACYDSRAQEVLFRAIVPDNSWFSIGIGGATMQDTDMISWTVFGGRGRTADLWSSGAYHAPPSEDLTQDLEDEVEPQFDSTTGLMTFMTRRKLDTGDTSEDYLIALDRAMPMCWAYKNSATFSKHDAHGVWSLTLSEEKGAEAGGIDEKELLRIPKYEEHGLWMWSAWYVVGLLLLITKRYVKKHWISMHYLHALLGYFTLAVTIIFVAKIA